MAKKKEVSRQVPIDEPEHQNGGGRVQSLPSVLERRKREPAEVIEEEPQPQGNRHASREQDTMISLEEYNAVAELLHPGRTPEELDSRTDVNSLQIIHFSRARVMAKRFGIRYLDVYVTHIERLSLSHKRKSRLEHVKALSGLVDQNNQSPSLLQRLG